MGDFLLIALIVGSLCLINKIIFREVTKSKCDGILKIARDGDDEYIYAEFSEEGIKKLKSSEYIILKNELKSQK